MLAAFNTSLRNFRDWNCALQLTFTCFELYSPNVNIYTGFLNVYLPFSDALVINSSKASSIWYKLNQQKIYIYIQLQGISWKRYLSRWNQLYLNITFPEVLDSPLVINYQQIINSPFHNSLPLFTVQVQ